MNKKQRINCFYDKTTSWNHLNTIFLTQYFMACSMKANLKMTKPKNTNGVLNSNSGSQVF